MKKNKISFCTVCMNRIQHIIQTLVKNIKDNEDYEDVEFVLLDYNSKDGLQEYVRENLIQYIEDGRLVYYRTDAPEYFNRSHSRNLAFKLATGDIICNVDADNFIGFGFASYINTIFSDRQNIFLSAIGRFDVIGRIAVRNADFYRVNGFDERMIYYGFEDLDFMQRLVMAGVKPKYFDNHDYLRAISHSNKDRMANEFVMNNFQRLFLNYISPFATGMIFLFSNNTFFKGTIINQIGADSELPRLKLREFQYDYSLKEKKWLKGEWQIKRGIIALDDPEQEQTGKLKYDKKSNSFKLSDMGNLSDYYEITSNKTIEEALFFYSQITNRYYLELNQELNNYKVNPDGFGLDAVTENFDYENA